MIKLYIQCTDKIQWPFLHVLLQIVPFFLFPRLIRISKIIQREFGYNPFFFLLFNFPIIHYFFFTVCVFYLMQHLKIHRTNACQLKYQMYIKKQNVIFFTKGQSILHEWKQCCDFTQNAPSPLMLPTLPPNIGLFPHHMETHTFFLKHFSNHFFCKIKNKQMHIPWKMNVSVFYVSTAHIHYLHRASEVL